jgi:hypothetical protein
MRECACEGERERKEREEAEGEVKRGECGRLTRWSVSDPLELGPG